MTPSSKVVAVPKSTAITVEVSPSQAQQLIVAQRTDKLTAMLRNPDDREPMPERAMDLNALLGIEPPHRSVIVQQAIGPEIIVGGRGALVATAGVAQVSVDGLRAKAQDDEAVSAGHAVEKAAWALHRFDREMPSEAISYPEAMPVQPVKSP